MSKIEYVGNVVTYYTFQAVVVTLIHIPILFSIGIWQLLDPSTFWQKLVLILLSVAFGGIIQILFWILGAKAINTFHGAYKTFMKVNK